MKKQFLQLGLAAFVMILFASCSSDDDGVSISDESVKLRGTWELESIIQNNSNIDDFPCEVKRGFTFNQNFTYTETSFFGEDSNDCQVAANFNGEWDNVEDGELRLRRAGQPDVETLRIRFVFNNTGFEVEESPNRKLVYRKVN